MENDGRRSRGHRRTALPGEEDKMDELKKRKVAKRSLDCALDSEVAVGKNGTNSDAFAAGFASVNSTAHSSPIRIVVRRSNQELPGAIRDIGPGVVHLQPASVPIPHILDLPVAQNRPDDEGDDDVLNEPTIDNGADAGNIELVSGEDDVENGLIDVDFPLLRTRTSPRILVNALKQLNPMHIGAVKGMGFGGLLYLNITALPQRLCYWVLENFDPRSCELNLQKGRTIHVDPRDVHVTLGLPKGPISIQKKPRHEHSALLATWAGFFSKKRDKILPKEVVKKMLDEIDGGVWFKRHFLILVTSCIIEAAHNGYVLPQIMDHLDDIDNVANLNWCEYMLTRLINCKMDWDKNKMKEFRGPILFLTVMYVDRVMLFTRAVPRAFPLIKGWDRDSLKKRENQEISADGFGAGFLYDRLKPPKATEVEAIQPPQQSKRKKTTFVPEGNNMHVFTDKLLAKAKIMADTMSEIMEMVQTTPKELLNDLNFNRVFSTTQQLLGRSKGDVPAADRTDETPWTEELGDDKFWADRLGIIEEIEDGLRRKMKYNSIREEEPSFSLGLTQEEIDVDENPTDMNHPVNDHMDCGPMVNEHREAEHKAAERNAVVDMDGKERGKAAEDNTQNDGGGGQLKLVDKCKDAKQKGKKINVEPEQQKMVRRTGRQIKKTESFASPYVKRAVTVSERLDKLDKDLFYWVLCNDDADMEEILFSNGRSDLRRREMMTIVPTSYVSTAVVDVWSQILNNKEKYRAATSPCRFFATTDPCCYTLVDPPKGWDMKRREDKFFEKLDEELKQYNGVVIGKIDMFFFPIYRAEHFYVMAFNVRRFRADLIDNSVNVDTKALDDAYGDTPILLKDKLVEYLKRNGQVHKASGLSKVPLTRLKMPWRDDDNKCDCAIYTMRHMETYMGTGQKWDAGLRSRSANQMAFLRSKYCAAILTSENNVYKDRNPEAATYYYRCSCEDYEIDVVDLLINGGSGAPPEFEAGSTE